jgi:hypothetical protein
VQCSGAIGVVPLLIPETTPRAGLVLNEVAAKLVEVFFHSNKEHAAIVGWAYLSNAPLEASTAVLLDYLRLSPEQWQQVSEEDSAELRKWFHRHQREDFVQGRIVKIHGYMLSETEARFCALAALV